MNLVEASQAPRPERADATRNRQKVLAAARRLFAERGVERVTMSEVAREAGVAKGTVFHRFGDRSGLARALLDEPERELQDRILRGPPPLGPGAPARERLAALVDALLDLTEEQSDLLLEVDHRAAGGRYRTGAYHVWAVHLSLLLRELGSDRDPVLAAHVLLAPLAADLVHYLLREEGRSPADLRRVLREAVLRAAGA